MQQWALRSLAIVCDYMETTLFAIVCNLRSAIVCDHMETSLYRTPSKEPCPTLNYLYSYHLTKTVLCSAIYASAQTNKTS